jgi:hypothetical protein
MTSLCFSGYRMIMQDYPIDMFTCLVHQIMQDYPIDVITYLVDHFLL